VSNSIPIALTDLMNTKPNMKMEKVMLLGFGVGLSWGGCIVNLSMKCKGI
jgi:3-Oxoacyl-[acyl-carrier-protein (ACP)] synthase III C terminal.